MFKLRLISAIILIPLVILGILYLPPVVIAILSGLVFCLAAWEWLHMTVLKNYKIRFLLLFSLIVAAYSILAAGLDTCLVYWCALIWWLFALVGICYFPKGKKIWQEIFLQPFIGLLMFVPAWLAFNTLLASEPAGPVWVLLGCALIWGADIGAYLSGKLWGERKLIPAVSPGKTWAGLYGAFAAGLLIMTVFYFAYRPSLSLVHLLWLSVLTVFFAIVGDLVESMLKRIYGYKDSGKLIPGHGGAYDRIDSMLAAFPMYFLGLQILFNLRIMIAV